MSDSNWSVRAVVVGLLGALTFTALGVGFYGGALTSGPPQANWQQPSDATETQQGRAPAALPLQQGQEPAQLNEPCSEGEDNRSSDLCAQWKAADATESGTLATWIFGAIGTLIGSLTLAAAWSAAKWARKAAEHTEAGAVAAQQTLQADRAWITLSQPFVGQSENITVNNKKIRSGVVLRMDWENSGRSPALKMATFIDYRLIPVGSEIPVFAHEFAPDEGGAAVGVGKPLRTAMLYLDDRETALFRAHTHAIVVYSKVQYADIYHPKDRNVSEACLMILFTGGRPDSPIVEQNLILGAIATNNDVT